MRKQDELIVINDGSSDVNQQEFKELELIDSRIRVVNKQHTGLVDSLNIGLKLASNELIARSDVDDRYQVTRISKQVDFLEENPKVSAVFSDYVIVDPLGSNLGIIPCAVTPELTKFSLLNHQRTAHPSAMFRKSAVLYAGGYLADAFPAEDLALWIRLSSYSEIASIPEVLLKYLKNPSGISSMKNQLMKRQNKVLQRQLLEQISILRVLEEAEETLKQYESMPEGVKRQLLFFRDLLTFHQKTREISFKNFVNFYSSYPRYFDTKLIKTYLILSSEKKLRNRINVS